MCQTRVRTVTRPDAQALDGKERTILATPAGFSGLQGKALGLRKEDYPTKGEVMAVIPKHCLERSTPRSLLYLVFSTCILFGLGFLANQFVPLTLAFAPVWLAYAAANGTVAFGFWVVGHECGHGAFSDNKVLQDAVGFAVHSFCLTPYFSWQRSHAVHHSRVNHMHEGETHVPNPTEDGFAKAMHFIKELPVSHERGVGGWRRSTHADRAILSLSLSLFFTPRRLSATCSTTSSPWRLSPGGSSST